MATSYLLLPYYISANAWITRCHFNAPYLVVGTRGISKSTVTNICKHPRTKDDVRDIRKLVRVKEIQQIMKTRICNCECRYNLCQLWMAKFMGINKHNLQVYTKTFEFIHNIRRKANRRKNMFESILIGS